MTDNKNETRAPSLEEPNDATPPSSTAARWKLIGPGIVVAVPA